MLRNRCRDSAWFESGISYVMKTSSNVKQINNALGGKSVAVVSGGISQIRVLTVWHKVGGDCGFSVAEVIIQ